MKNQITHIRFIRLAAAVLLILFFSCFSLFGQDSLSYSLDGQEMIFSLKNCYIDSVIDSRGETGFTGYITRRGAEKQKLVMPGGVTGSLQHFIQTNIKADTAQGPVKLHVVKFETTIKQVGKRWVTDASLAVEFFGGETRLVELENKGHSESDVLSTGYLSSFLAKSIGSCLEKFDEWWGEYKSKISTTSDVKVNIRIATSTNKEEQIVYSFQRPLQISDFTGDYMESQGNEAATTNSGVGMEYKSGVINGQNILDVTLTPFFYKTRSWFRPEGKNDRVLAHEQTHFDITALKACELAALMKAQSFNKDNVRKLLEELQMKNAKELDEEQNRYDSETNHGLVADKQAEWQKKIKDQLVASGCY